MKRKKRFSFRILSACCLIIAVLTASCASGGNSEGKAAQSGAPTGEAQAGNTGVGDASESQPEYSGLNEFPIVEEKVEIRVACRYDSYVLDYENNDQTKYMEDITNVHIIWDILPEKEYLEKINLMISSGSQLPDVFMNSGFNNEMQVTYGTQGIIIPLNGLIEKHGYNYKQMIEMYPEIEYQITSPDGNIYSMPSYSATITNKLAQRFWINRTFMDALGINKLPETIDEFYDYCVAVRDGDPNGNGKSDEIAVLGETTGWMGNIDGFLMNAFIYCENNNDTNYNKKRMIYLADDGKVEFAPVQDQWREGLKYLRKLCAEGLLAPESFTLDQTGLRSLVELEDAMIVGAVSSGGTQIFADNNGTRKQSYEVLLPLEGPDGVKRATYDKYYGVDNTKLVITKDCKYPDIVMKWVDFCYTEDIWLRCRYGVPGRDWKVPPEGTVAVDGGPARYEEILVYSTPTNAYWHGAQPSWSRFGSHARELDKSDPYELEHVLWEAKVLYEPYKVDNVVPPIFYTLEESREYAELNKLIIDYAKQAEAQFVTGGWDLDKDWDRYLSELDSMGLGRLMEITQSGFDRQWASQLGFAR
ncbi:MAG: extracellular solute-binding protein [Clostridiales bacterium]|jgi:putative aldouronate transport system substrate-binding protein|nr:extracellular solute-binding protein [Clostridiales bacterium]